MRRIFSVGFLLVLRTAVVLAQGDSLSIARIWDSDEFQARGVTQIRWLDDASYTTLEPSTIARGARDLVKHDVATGRTDVLVAASALTPSGAAAPVAIANYSWSDDRSQLLIFTNTRRVWRVNSRGDYWVFNLQTKQLRKLGGDAPASTLMFAKLSPDGRRVAYVRQNNIYVEDVSTGRITQLTGDGSRTIINGTFDWVYEEELGMRDGFRWSPDGTRIAYWQLDASGVRDFLLINDTDSLYSFTTPVQYPKAGTTNSAARVGVVNATGGNTVWMQVDGDPRNNYIARMQWAGNSQDVAIQQLNRRQNRLRLLFGDAATGQVRPILVESDSTAWVELWDNGQLFADRQDHLRWLAKGDRFFWVSDRDGWRRLYLVSRDGARIRPVTPPGVDITQISAIDEPGGWAYYLAAPNEPTRRYLFRVKLDGSFKGERLTPQEQPGTHAYNMSPRGKWSVHTISTFDTPPMVDLVELPAHRSQRTLQDNAELRARVAAVRPGRAEFFRVDVGEGVQLDGWMIKPKDFDPVKKYPVLFEVYGEPAGTTVNDAWNGEGMLFHQYLADKGYLVMSLDNRGTPSPRGRVWRKSIYRRIGVLSAQDQAHGVKAIIAKYPFVDGSRIGIWGWSGGGSMTLNMLFRYPDVYHTGMAVAPVPDLRLYDTIYQERYTGLPDADSAAYAQGSPLNFARHLKGNLLVVHGSGDDNVHYQGTERLVNELVRHGKSFQLMVYPNRTHGIFEGDGTTVHVYSLLTRFLLERLPPGGKPAM
ncbi:MAG: S9 family peptidase [Gemmatimonadaceae bacterium]